MRKYDKYKDSGIDWLGAIPEHWEVKRAKNIFCYINRGTSPSYVEFSDFKVINQATFSKGFFNKENIRYTDKTSNKDSFACEKDILIASTGGGVLGKVHYFNEKGSAYIPDSHITILRGHKGEINTKYYYYFFSIHFHLINELLALGSTNQTELQRKYLFDFKLVYPEINVQTNIAQYLDTKTEAIDKKINLLEKKIVGYHKLKKSLINEVITKGLNKNVKLKDSGIDWIGKIPEHWEVKRLKEIGIIETSSVNKKIEESEKLVKLVNYTDVYSNVKREIRNDENYMIVSGNNLQVQSKSLKLGDVLFTPSSETISDIGVSSVVMENLDNTLYSYHLLRLRFNVKFDLNFKKYMFNNDFVQLYFSKNATGTTRKILGLNAFYNLKIVFPSINEQQAIASYLDTKTSTIDKIITNIQTQITTLKALRKTLINDVVTGKIKVVD